MGPDCRIATKHYHKEVDAEGSGFGFESRPRPSESMKLLSTYKLIPSTQNSTNVDSLELHL